MDTESGHIVDTQIGHRVDTESGHRGVDTEWTQRVDTESGHREWTQRVDTEWTKRMDTEWTYESGHIVDTDNGHMDVDKAEEKGEPYKDEDTPDMNMEFGRSGLESEETPSKAVDEAEAKNYDTNAQCDYRRITISLHKSTCFQVKRCNSAMQWSHLVVRNVINELPLNNKKYFLLPQASMHAICLQRKARLIYDADKF